MTVNMSDFRGVPNIFGYDSTAINGKLKQLHTLYTEAKGGSCL